MRAPKLILSPNNGTGGVVFPPEWERVSARWRLDVLQDWITVLQDAHRNASDEDWRCLSLEEIRRERYRETVPEKILLTIDEVLREAQAAARKAHE